MTLIWMRGALIAMLFVSDCAAFGQSAQEPLPSVPAPAPLVLPKTGGLIPLYSSKPQDVPPPAPLPSEDENYCSTPSATSYRTGRSQGGEAEKPQSAEAKRAMDAYTRSLMQQIYQNWKIPFEARDPWLKGAEVRIRFEIEQDGTLNDPVIMMSSGRTSYDRRAIESVKHAAPFAPPPAGTPSPFKMCTHFRYKMDRDGREALPVDVFAKKPAVP